MTFQLRPYQEQCCDAIEKEWLFGGVRSTMVEMATGLGKTEVFTEVARRSENERTLTVCPMTSLVGQAANKFLARTGIMPDIEQACFWANESRWAHNQFVVGSKQTLTKERVGGERYKRFKDIGLLVLDEAHLTITKPYEQMVRYFLDQGATVLGVTATAERLDKRSMENIYETCCFQYGITDAVPDGWLVGCKTNCIQIQSMDLSEVGTTGGDFTQEELNKILEQDEVILEIAAVTARESGKMKTAVYCSSVIEAKGVAHVLCDSYGIRASFFPDKKQCTDERRKEVLDSFTQDPNGIQIVCNVGVLTTGWDFPALEHIVQARPTKSMSLYTQIFGRGTRPLPGVVDFPGSTPELRRAAIADSRKPHFRMTDLVDNSLEHKICTSTDVMAGKLGIDVIERVKKELIAGGAPMDLDEAILDAKQAIEKEREERERQRRAQIQANVRYRSVEVDPFDPYSRGSNVSKQRTPSMLFGKHKGKPLTQVPLGYLKWVQRDPVRFKYDLESLRDEREIDIRIHSGGGSVGDGFSMFDRIMDARRRGQIVNTFNDGAALSMAAIIFQAGTTRIVGDHSVLMLHNPHINEGGEAKELRKAADLLDKMAEKLTGVVVERSKQPRAKVRAWFDAETWFDAQECIANGLADKRYIDRQPHSAYVGDVFAQYKVPSRIRAKVRFDIEKALTDLETEARIARKSTNYRVYKIFSRQSAQTAEKITKMAACSAEDMGRILNALNSVSETEDSAREIN